MPRMRLSSNKCITLETESQPRMGVLHRGFIIWVCLDEAVDYP